MVLKLENCNDCTKYMFPQLQIFYELDHSSGHNSEQPDGLSTMASVINLVSFNRWYSLQMTNPPILQPNAPKFDTPVNEGSTTDTKGRVVEGYANKPKGADQILCECSFIDVNGWFLYGSKVINLLGVLLILTPKCHPEIADRGVEYAWGYLKLRFRQDFNDAVARNLKANVLKSLFTNV